jgi:long-chain acyl-CoA synthetase
VSWSSPERYKDGSVGKVLGGVDVKIVADDDRVLPSGEQGEILISGPNVFAGYYKDPETSAGVFKDMVVDGASRRYFRTGDIGTLDTEGFLAITGRKKEMLIVGGFNVFPRAIEEVLNNHPSVKDSGVVGRPDGLRGEVPVAFVEIKEGERFDENALRSHCREHLAGFKVPRDIIRVDAMPRTPTGKVLRRKLKELLPAETP